MTQEEQETKELVTNNLKINPEYEKIVPYIKNDEYSELKESIKTDGLHHSIVINQDGVILDGHHRYKICKELGIEPKTEIKTFSDILKEKKYVIVSNLKRRQLNDFQKSELGFELEKVEKEEAKKRYESIMPKKGEKGFKPMLASIDANIKKGKTSEIVSKKAGLSTKTYERAKKIIKEGTEEIKDKLRKGQVSINYAHKQIKRKESHSKTPDLPKGQFDVLLADPPWPYDINTRGSPDEHYNVMKNDDIYNLPVPSANNCILFLWATAPKLIEALNTIKNWGFKYKTHAIWIKDKIGTGYYFRGQHELLLIGEKGDMPVPEEKNRAPSIFQAPRNEHSRKPELVYELIEKMYPNRKYLEIFARNQRPNWTSWGNEIH